MSDNYKAPDMSYFVSFTDIDGESIIAGINSIQFVAWSKKNERGTVALAGRCPIYIDKCEWVHLVEELAHYKAR